MHELPGCEGDYGRRPAAPLPETERKPRLIPVDRTQMRMAVIDVERLIPEDHEARAIWELVGTLDLSSYYDRIDSVEGSAGSPACDPHLLILASGFTHTARG
jgi:hypothetical protein